MITTTKETFNSSIFFEGDMQAEIFDYQYIKTIKKGFHSRILHVKKNNENFAVRVIQDLHSRVNLVRAIREILILSNCEHENIIKMVDILIDSPTNLNTIYIVMPLMDFTLKHFIGLTKWREENPNYYIRHIMIQILRALNYLHFNNIIHRDITPQNIMMKDDNLQLKLIDFEVARELIEQNSIFTLSQPMGNFHSAPCTSAYQAPERLLRLDYYDSKTDMWPVGCILVELICGQPLISNTKNYIEILTDIFSMEKEIPSIYVSYLEEIAPTLISKSGRVFKSIDDRFEFPSPNENDNDKIAHSAKNGLKVLKGLLQLDPEKRWDAEKALKFKFFGDNNLKPKCLLNSEKCKNVFVETNILLGSFFTSKLTELLMEQIKSAPRNCTGSDIEIWPTATVTKFKNIFGSNLKLFPPSTP